jgi:hypothetical protein
MAKSKKPLTKTDNQTEADGVSSKLDGSFLNDAVFAEPDAGEADPDAPQVLDENGQIIVADEAAPEPHRLDRAAFYTTVKALFGMPAFYDRDFAPLAVQSHEEDQARAASDACFELVEIWFPAMLEQNNDTLGHLLVAVPFLAAKVIIVRDIMRNKKADALAANDNRAPAANDNRAPTLSGADHG